MAQRTYRLEVWNRLNTQRLAILTTVQNPVRRQVLKLDETLRATVALGDDALQHLTSGAVLRLQEESSASEFSLWRLTARERERTDGDATYMRLSADALWMDLRHGRVRQVLADGRTLFDFGLVGLSPTDWIADYILPGFDGDAISFQTGVVEWAGAVDLNFERTSPLAALRMLEAETGGELQFRLSPDGTFYYVDLLARVGNADGGAELRYAKNIRGLTRLEDDADVISRLYGIGDGMLTLADAEWEITGIAGRTLSFGSDHPVFEDNAFAISGVPTYFYVPGKGARQVESSDADAGTITLVSVGTFTTGDVGYLASDTGGTRLTYLESPTARTAYGVLADDYRLETVPDAKNLLTNGDFSSWSAGLPVGWTALGAPTVSEETSATYVKQGTSGARVVAAAADEGLISDAFTIEQTDLRPYTGLRVLLTAVSGRVRVELRHSNGINYPVEAHKGSEGVGVYLDLSIGPVHDTPLPAGTAQLAIVAHGAAATFVVDGAMVTAQIAEEVPGFTAGNGAVELWALTADELARRRRGKLEYRVDVVDLYKADPDRFPYDELRLGDDVKVRDPEIGQETLRVVELEEDMTDAVATRVSLAEAADTRPETDESPYLPRYRPRRTGARLNTVSAQEAQVVWARAEVVGTDFLISAVGNARTATLELYTKEAWADPYPATPDSTITGRQGTFAALTIPTDALYFRIVAKDGRGVAGTVPLDSSWTPPGSAAAVSGRLRAVDNGNGTASLYLWVEGPVDLFPVTARFYEDDPTDPPINLVGVTTTHVFEISDEIGPETYANLVRTLPLKQTRHWWASLADAAGNPVVWCPAAQDRDTLPGGAAIPDDYKENPTLVLIPDEDVTDWVRVTCPDGETKTFNAPFASLPLEYIAGATARDDSSTEADFSTDETRGDYVVEVSGGGTTLEIWRGPLHGTASNPPVAEPTVTLDATNRDAVDVSVRLTSPVGEQVTVEMKETDAPGADIWQWTSVAGGSTVKYVDSGDSADANAEFFASGESNALMFNNIPLVRDQVSRIYVRAKGKDSGVVGAWVPVVLNIKEQPWLESVDGVWNEETDEIELTAIGGAFCASATFEIADNDSFSGSREATQDLADGERVTAFFSMSSADRGKLWWCRVIPHNGASGTGLDGVGQRDTVLVPGTELGINAPTAVIQLYLGETDAEQVRYTGTLGTGGTAPLEYRRRIDHPLVGEGIWSSWAPTPETEVVWRDPLYVQTIVAEVRDADGRTSAETKYVVNARNSFADPGSGHILPTVPFHGGGYPESQESSQRRFGRAIGFGHVGYGYEEMGRDGYAGLPGGRRVSMTLTDATGQDTLLDTATPRLYNVPLDETIQDHLGRSVHAMYAKALPGDPDTADSIASGSTLRVTTLNEATGGGRGYGGFSNASGGLVSTASHSGGTLVSRMFAKALTGDPNTFDYVPEGTTYRRTTANDKTGAGYAFGSFDAAAVMKTTVEDATGRQVRLMFAKAVVGDPDTFDGVPEGVSFKRTTANEKSGAGYAYSGLNSSGEVIVGLRGDIAIRGGDFWVPSNFYINVGDVSTDYITKTVRIPHAELVPYRDDITTFRFTEAYVTGQGPLATDINSFRGAVVLPPGVIVRSVSIRGYGDVEAAFFRITSSGTWTSLATMSIAGASWQTDSAALSETVSASSAYAISVSVEGVTDQSRFAYAEIEYDMPAYRNSL